MISQLNIRSRIKSKARARREVKPEFLGAKRDQGENQETRIAGVKEEIVAIFGVEADVKQEAEDQAEGKRASVQPVAEKEIAA